MKFTFRIGSNIQFQCQLVSEQCSSKCKNGEPCKRRVVMGLPYCWNHLLLNKHLRVQKSTIPNGGKGLFVINKKINNNTILFRKGDRIIEYSGEIIDDEELDRRYKDEAAPYTLEVEPDINIDCACARSAGGIANTKPSHNNAVFRLDEQSRQHKVYLVATKNIRNNSEVFVSYGRTYRMHGNFSHNTK